MECSNVGGSIAKESNRYPTIISVLVCEAGAYCDGDTRSDYSVCPKHPKVEITYMHGSTLAFAVTGGFTHEFCHHALKVTAFSHQVSVSAMGRANLIIVVQRYTHSRCHRFFTYIQVQKARQFGFFC
jgi:hypothetical protein